MAALDSTALPYPDRHEPPTVRCRDNGDIDLGQLAFEHPAALPALDAVIRAAEQDGVGVCGLHWSQFLGLLRRTPLDHLLDVCNHIRAVVERCGADDPTHTG